QICSACHNRNHKAKDLKIRRWECPVCHAVHDRDINAAKNILYAGLRLLQTA
ncbi:MAG: transposase, partial [Oscillospiraceae bacterium]|nr:transposase [Oscillospiraceae bacterium]